VRGGSAMSSGLLSTRVSPDALAMRVIELIRRESLDLGAHLTEQWVADNLDISRAPARRTVSFLVDITRRAHSTARVPSRHAGRRVHVRPPRHRP
jgi:DNA-binding GntR family transcriptional regulator